MTDNLSAEMSPEMADMLPDEIRQMLELQKEKRLQQIQEIGNTIAKKRDEAVNARKQSGIEEQWLEDEEYYLGIDDANRSENKSYKPSSPNGSFQTIKRNASRSTVFLNITRPYVDAAAARTADMLLPTDDRNWSIKPTPMPQLEDMRKAMQPQAQMPVPMPGQQPGMPMPQPGMPAGMGAMPPQQMNPIALAMQQAEQILTEARSRAEKAEKRIEDWLVQCQWHAEIRKVIEDASRLGTGVLKGPSPYRAKRMAVKDGALVMEISIDPESRRIDPWNLFPDPACGENIHNGSYVIERDDLSARSLRDLKDLPGYLAEQIDKVLEEGPGKKNLTNGRIAVGKSTEDDERFEVWYYHGVLDRDDLETLGVDVEQTGLMDGVPAIVTMVNDTPIKAHINPLDSGEFPYDVMCWQRQTGSWAGVGVARQIRTPQRMVNAATRNMMDNAGLSGGPILMVRRNLVEPADGSWDLTPRKVFYVREEADVRTVSDAIGSIIIPSNQPELSNIIQFALKMAEDVTGLPMIMQGQQGQAPDTVGGMQMMQNNAGTVLRRIAKTFDDCITEPHIRRYYQWLMEYGEDSEKGDFQIDARGSAALVERDLQNQAILQMGQLVMNPNFGIDPEKWFAEACRAQRLDPKKFQMDDEKKAQMAQRQPPPPPQVQAAQIRAQADLQKLQMSLQADAQQTQAELGVDMARIKRDTDRDLVYVQAEAERTAVEGQYRMSELQLRRDLAMLDYANKREMALEDVKRSLAETTMKLQTQKELAGMTTAADLQKHHAKQVATPAVEPPGRAPAGQAFQR